MIGRSPGPVHRLVVVSAVPVTATGVAPVVGGLIHNPLGLGYGVGDDVVGVDLEGKVFLLDEGAVSGG